MDYPKNCPARCHVQMHDRPDLADHHCIFFNRVILLYHDRLEDIIAIFTIMRPCVHIPHFLCIWCARMRLIARSSMRTRAHACQVFSIFAPLCVNCPRIILAWWKCNSTCTLWRFVLQVKAPSSLEGNRLVEISCPKESTLKCYTFERKAEWGLGSGCENSWA